MDQHRPMDETARDTLPIDREYRYGLESALSIILIGWPFAGGFFAVGLGSLCWALFDSKPFEVGGIKLLGLAATLAKLIGAVFMLGFTAAFVADLRKQYRARGRRIALTPEGVLLPRDEFSKEKFVRYRDILRIRFPGLSADLETRAGSYSIERNKLRDRDFDELTLELMIRARQAQATEHPQSGHAIPGPRTPSSQQVTEVANLILRGRKRREVRAYLERLGFSEEEVLRTTKAARPLIRQGSRAAGQSMFVCGVGLLLIAVAATAFQYHFLLGWLGHKTIYVSATIIGTGFVYTLMGLLKSITGWNIR